MRRLENKQRCVISVQLDISTIKVCCLGEGGLTLSRIQSECDSYFAKLRRANPGVLIFDLGTNDLCAPDNYPELVHTKLCRFVKELPE